MPEIDEKFIWGIAGFTIGVFFSSFISELAKDTYSSVKQWIQFKLKSEHLVEHDFRSKIYVPQHYTWITEDAIKDKEKQNWTHHPHPKYGGKCIRMLGSEKLPKKEYLMVVPNPTKL